MSGLPNKAGFEGERPILPPIRDLFREELSGSHVSLEPPSSILARLSVSDDDLRGHPRGPGAHFARSPPLERRSLSGPKPSPRNSDVLASPTYTSSLLPPSSSGSRYVPSRSMSYSAPSSSRLGEPAVSPRRNVPHRNSISTTNYTMESRGGGHTPIAQYGSMGTRFETPRAREGAPWTGTISTAMDRRHYVEDEEQTPVARARGTPVAPMAFDQLPAPASQNASGAKYECTYCGKGFNRPSSLKIHLNSHTGEKPFVCPVEGCGRSFSVLSNMRRHARVHSTGESSLKAADSSDEGGEYAAGSPQQTSSSIPARGTADFSTWRQQRRRDSIASATSTTSSRRSRSASIASDEEEAARPGKRRK
ncbi:hypothetical protein HDZ31DRAFT_64665 [Schizophyllum fasciatum]